MKEEKYTSRIAAQFMSGGASQKHNEEYKRKLMELWELEKQLPEDERKFSIFLAMTSIHIIEEYKDTYEKAIVSASNLAKIGLSTSGLGERLAGTALKIMQPEQ